MCDTEMKRRISQLTHKLDSALEGNPSFSFPSSKKDEHEIAYYSTLDNNRVIYLFNVAGIPFEGIHAFIETNPEDEQLLSLKVECDPLSYYHRGYNFSQAECCKRVATIDLISENIDLETLTYKLKDGFLIMSFDIINHARNETKSEEIIKTSFHQVY